jgi:hypothetical protein
MKRKSQDTGTPGSPRDICTPASPSTAVRVDRLRDRLTIGITSSIILASIAIEKHTLGQGKFCAFWIMRAKRGKNSWVGAFAYHHYDTGF